MYVNFFFMHSDVIISTEWLKSRITVKTNNERNIPAIDIIIFPMRASQFIYSSFSLVKVKEVKGTYFFLLGLIK